MRVLNDYACSHCGWQAEQFLENAITQTPCLECGGSAKKVRSVPNFQLPGNDPAGFPTAHAQWERKRDQKIRQEQSSESS